MPSIEDKYEAALLMLNAFMYVSTSAEREGAAFLAGMTGSAAGLKWQMIEAVAGDAAAFARSAKWQDAVELVGKKVAT